MSIRTNRLLTAVYAAAAACALAVAAPAAAYAHGQPSTMDIQLLAINDFHGTLAPPTGSSGSVTELDSAGNKISVPAGGVAYLATQLATARVGHPNTVTVSAGDNVGASPLLSAAFHDEPTILALSKLGVSVSAVGNHEFDEGSTELKRLQYGGCRTDDGCYDPSQPFTGAKFRFLTANVTTDRTGLPLFPPFWIQNVNGAKIGFIGVSLKDTPSIVTASGVAGLKFGDEVKSANGYAKLLSLLGVNAIVAVVHDGGNPASPVYNYDCDTPTPGAGLSGSIVDVAKGLDPRIDLVITGHSHQSYVCDIPDPAGKPRLVTSALSGGRLFTDVQFTYDKRTHDVVRSTAHATNRVVTRDVTPDPDMTALVDKYQTLIAPIANKPVGYISADIPGKAARPEQPLGDLIADAQQEATASASTGGAVIAITNPGGIRADLTYAASGAEGAGVVTYGEAFTVQPFNNYLETLDLTGAQLVTLLQQQYSGGNAASPKVLQVSAGLRYTVDNAKTGADKIVVDSIRINGAPLDQAATYRITVNNFLAGGGDNFPILTQGTNPLVGELDIDAFVAYLTAHSSATAPIAPPAADRITFVN